MREREKEEGAGKCEGETERYLARVRERTCVHARIKQIAHLHTLCSTHIAAHKLQHTHCSTHIEAHTLQHTHCSTPIAPELKEKIYELK